MNKNVNIKGKLRLSPKATLQKANQQKYIQGNQRMLLKFRARENKENNNFF